MKGIKAYKVVSFSAKMFFAVFKCYNCHSEDDNCHLWNDHVLIITIYMKSICSNFKDGPCLDDHFNLKQSMSTTIIP